MCDHYAQKKDNYKQKDYLSEYMSEYFLVLDFITIISKETISQNEINQLILAIRYQYK